MMRKLPMVIAVFGVSLILSGTALSQDATAKRVKLIRVKDNKTVSTSIILSKIKTKTGDIFSQDILNDDLKRLYSLGFFSDISIDVSDYKDGVAVSFIVEEKPVIRKIEFKGNESIRDKHLKKEISSKEGEMFDPGKISQDLKSIGKFYEKKGYHLAEINYSSDIDEKANEVTVTIFIQEHKNVRIKHIFLEGNESFPDKILLRIMSTRPDTLLTSGYFKSDTFEDDMEKLRAFYHSEGYLDASFKKELEYYNSKKNMDITVIIDEGAKYLVGNIQVSGNTIFSREEILDTLKLTGNRAFSQEKMALDSAHIQEIYYNRGYIMCRVYPEPKLNEKTGRIDISYSINEDRMIYVNRVEIAGNTKTKDFVIRRELRAYPGEPFSGADIKRSKERLRNLGYFEDISFDTKETGDPAKRDLLVNVKETKTGEFSFGGGYSSIDRLIGFASISQRNFDITNFPTFTGGGQNLTLRGELGFVKSNYFLGWTDPWIFGFPYSFGFDLYRTAHKRERDAGYGWEEERWGGDMRLGKEITEWLRTDFMYKFERVNISDMQDNVAADVLDEKGTKYLSSLVGSLTFDTRDNIFNPKKGFYVSTAMEDAGGPFLGDVDFLKYTIVGKYYISFIDKFVLELKARGGLASEYGDSDRVPIYERFYAGGSGSIRGYSERGVGPRDRATGDPIGGDSMVVGNAELTYPVFKDTLKGAIFCDIGNVWNDTWDIGDGDYKYGAGVGVRVKTPVGPVKLDWGYPLKKIPSEKQKGRFYFSMSHGF